jgi:pimeloyl-[acyl-carrier protein] methyl ester esterase
MRPQGSDGVRLYFVHGWSFDPEVWDALGARLASAPQTRANLGGFGPALVPDFRPGDILIGHSAGLLWGLKNRQDWKAVVAINSFARFTQDEAGRGCVRPATLRAMRRNLSHDAQTCVATFRASLGAPPPPPGAQLASLMEGLDLLRDYEAAPPPCPFLVLGAQNDILAPPAAARELAALSGGKLCLSKTGRHGLPWTEPDFCAENLKRFLAENDL